MTEYFINAINDKLYAYHTLIMPIIGKPEYAKYIEEKFEKTYRAQIRCNIIVLTEPTIISANKQLMYVSYHHNVVWPNPQKIWHLYGQDYKQEKRIHRAMGSRYRAFNISINNAKIILGDYEPFSFNEIERVFYKEDYKNEDQ